MIKCEGEFRNFFGHFVKCKWNAQYRVFINPPKKDDSGNKVLCDICANSYRGFRKEKLS